MVAIDRPLQPRAGTDADSELVSLAGDIFKAAGGRSGRDMGAAAAECVPADSLETQFLGRPPDARSPANQCRQVQPLYFVNFPSYGSSLIDTQVVGGH